MPFRSGHNLCLDHHRGGALAAESEEGILD
jgi:hypothetical protein